MNKHEKIILEFKNLLKDICKTRYYQHLKIHYRPRSVTTIFNRDGTPNHILLEDLDLLKKQNSRAAVFAGGPDKENMSYAFNLLRQFLLGGKNDPIALINIGKHIKAIGNEEDYQKFISILKRIEIYKKKQSGIIDITIIEYINNLFYSDMVHRNEEKIIDDYIASYHLPKYYLKFLSYFCRIGMIIKLPEFDEEFFGENCCPEKILYGPQLECSYLL